MSDAFEIASIALNAQQKALDVLAGNIANINTPAFKRSDVRFSDLLLTQADPTTPSANLAENSLSGGVIAHTVTPFDRIGEIRHTGQPLDIAINGDGFIELLGARGKQMLWRGGSLAIREDGTLGTAGGVPLRAMITVPPDASNLRIDRDGSVTALLPGAADRVELGQIDLIRALDPAGVRSAGGGYYDVLDGAMLDSVTAGSEGVHYLVQGAIEQSNVNLNDEMVQLMIVQRSYAANAQVVQAADQLASINNSLRR